MSIIRCYNVQIKTSFVLSFLFQDPGWDSIDDEELYTDEEFQRFESEREQQIKYEHEP